MATEPSASGRKKLSDKTRNILIIIFAVLWLGINVYQQVRFTGAHRGAMELAGDYTQFAVQAAGLAGAFISGDMVGAGQFALASVTNSVLVGGLKETIDTTRPNGDPHSFPSGHTAFAFQGAAFIQRRYGWKVGILALLAAGFVGVSRVEADKHYVRDVVAGALIGTACSLLFTRPRTAIKGKATE